MTRRLSSGITLSQSKEMAVRHADKILESQQRLVELKAYYISLYDAWVTQTQSRISSWAQHVRKIKSEY